MAARQRHGDSCLGLTRSIGLFSSVISIVLVLAFISPVESIRFLGERETYAKYPKWYACTNASIQFEFKTRQANGLLMFTDDRGQHEFIQVAMVDGGLILWINFFREGNQTAKIELGANLNDGLWHTVVVKRNRLESTLLVDISQKSTVGFGSGQNLEGRLETNSYMFFGGLPSRFDRSVGKTVLPMLVQSTPFVGEIRNILYFNCSCMPVRPAPLEERGTERGPGETCDIRNPCHTDCVCISGDESPGCQCIYRQNCLKDLLADYTLPMDTIERDIVQNPSGLDSRVYGDPKLVRGVHEMGLQIDGVSQWLRVSGADHKGECFGDLSHCDNGYYVGMWVQFLAHPRSKAVYMSNGGHSSDGHGIAMYYSDRGLEFVFKTKDGKEWRAEARDIIPGIWYHVAASWDKEKGLHVYINGFQVSHSKQHRKVTASRDGGQFKEFVIGRSNERSGHEQQVPMIVDDFLFKSSYKLPNEVKEDGPAFHYYLPMDKITQSKLEMIGGDASVVAAVGTLQTVPGLIGQALSFASKGDYVDLGESSKKCLGNVESCTHGIYISFYVKFRRIDGDRGYIFSSPHGIDIYRSGSQLFASAQKERSIWEAQYRGLMSDIWYFVEVSWSKDSGIALFVNGEEVDRQIDERPIREPRFTTEMNVFIGRSNQGARVEQLGNTELDDMNIFYGTRDMLSSIGFIQTDRPENYHIDFERIQENKILHDSLHINLVGSPRAARGKVGRALRLHGTNDYVEVYVKSPGCFSDLDLCQQGVLYSLWIHPDRLRNNTYYLSTGNKGIALLYRNGALTATAETSSHRWETSSPNLEPNKWNFVEVSYHPARGLQLYINNELKAQDSSSERVSVHPGSSDQSRFYLGRSKTEESGATLAEATFDEMEMWQADRDYLSSHGYIQRTRPKNYLIDFEEFINEDRLKHPTLTINLNQRPMLIPGKVNNALELSGRGQYADLGRRNDECMGNLYLCTQGITIAAWMRFHRFENNMVFLSTGENGILMTYKDGYIQISAAGDNIITIPRFDTDRWYFVEITWHPKTGLKVYVDNELREKSDRISSPRSSTRGNFYIGYPNTGDIYSGKFTHGIFDVDEMEIWYSGREDLLAFGYINRDNLGYESFSFDMSEGSRIIHTKYTVTLHGAARLIPGRIGNAVGLSGQRQFVDLGEHYQRCLGNIDLCSHGFTMSVWLNPRELRDGTTFISAPTYNIGYQNGRLRSEFQSKTKRWSASTNRLKADEWQRLTLAWHPKKGLSMYLNDELADEDTRGVDAPQRDQPISEHVYIGRPLQNDRVTANLMADELQVWHDDLDQLRATGQYKVQAVPINIIFDDFRNNLIRFKDREIRSYGDIRFEQGRSSGSRALYLVGTTGYLDLGNNFTCGGDLNSCHQGATIRLGIRPDQLQENTVFFDSFPVKIYYQNGRLHGQLQTPTQIWTVNTPEVQARRWQRVELTWHPRDGLVMYIDGRKVDSQKYATEQQVQPPSDWRTYFGRSLEGRSPYVRGSVDSIEFWTAYRDYLPEDAYLRLPPYVPPVTARPPDDSRTISIIGDFNTAQRTPKPASSRQVKILDFNGQSFVMFNFHELPQDYLYRKHTEDLQFYFHPRSGADGLLWLHEDRERKMYIALKDGYLEFVNDDLSGKPDIIKIGQRDGARFVDGRWYLFKLKRDGRKITMSVDDKHEETLIFSKDVQFLAPAYVYLAGTDNTYGSTNGRILLNFNGGMAQVLYKGERKDGTNVYAQEVNLIAELGDKLKPGITVDQVNWPDQPWPDPTAVTVPTAPTRAPQTRPPQTRTPRPTQVVTQPPPPPPALTKVTIKDDFTFFVIQQPFYITNGNSLSFKFQTINDKALLLYTTGNLMGRNFFELEIYDGLLYFVHNFGGSTKRTLVSEREVSDGQQHEISVRFLNNLILVTLDGQQPPIRISLQQGEQFPTASTKINIGGYSTYESLPWHTWARSNYQGCIEDFKMNGQIVDFQSLLQLLPSNGQVEGTCRAMPQECSSRPCTNGYCVSKWGSYYCDCRATEFTGQQCQSYALTGVFNGTHYYKMTVRPSIRAHVDDMSFRLKTLSPDGFIFQTRDKANKSFIRAELEGGRIKITTFFDGKVQTHYLGSNLNDLQWHTVYIQRRGNQLEFWVDDKNHEKKTISGENFYLNIDDVFVGGYGTGDVTANSKYFVGYLQNLFVGNFDIFSELSASGQHIFPTSSQLPPMIFHDVTFPSYQAHILLPTLTLYPKLNVHFYFKTNDPNGVILFNEGRNSELFAVELFDGRIHVKIDIPGKAPLRISTPENRRFNDGQWHSVSLVGQTVDGQKQLIMSADELQSSNSYALLDQVNLQGPLYVGGIPEAVSQKANVKSFLLSKSGYRGCMASVYFGDGLPNLYDYGVSQNVNVLNTCQDIVSQCTKTTCKNGGICHDHLNNGTTWCDCSKTAYGGPLCEDEPFGYYFRNQLKTDLYGMLIYRYPTSSQSLEHQQDEIILGVMTDERNSVLVRLLSDIFNDFVELKIVNGYIVAVYDTDGKGASTTITNTDVMVSDKQYHIIKFVRTKDKGVLTVDNSATANTHATAHGDFNALNKIFIGGTYQGKKILEGYHGIIGGLYVNGKLIFHEKMDPIFDVVIAPHPYRLGTFVEVTSAPWLSTTPRPTPSIVIPPDILPIPVIPPDIGGGGVSWTGIGAGGTAEDGVNVVVFPDLSGGSAGDLTALTPGGLEPVAAAQISFVPSLPAVGPRAGAVMGTILGLAALASSLMWAFYRCKPGWCAGLKPAETPLTISPPRTNMPLAKTVAGSSAGMGAGGASGASGAGGAGDVDVVDTVALGAARSVGGGAGAGGVGTTLYQQQSASSVHQRNDSYDSATLRATGTFTNKGTAIGTPRMGRHQMGSTSTSYTESNVITPASMQSYHFEGGNSTADYDVASGVHSNYQGNTLNAAGGGFSSSTMSSNYNYSVRTIQNVGGQQAMMGYAAGSLSNVIVTPGAMGEEIRVDCCLMTGDGHSVVTGSSLGPPQVWNMNTGELLRIMQGETVGSTNLHLVCNDKLLVGAINTDLEINQYSTPKGVHNYQFQIWDFASGRPLDMAQQEVCSALTVMSDNDKVVFGRSDKFGGGTNVVVWDLLGNQAIKEMRYDAPVGNNDYISYINLSQNDRYVVAGFNNTFDNFAEFVIFDMTLTSYNITDPNILRLNAAPECTAILPHDEAVTGLRNGDLVVWSLRTGQPSRQLFSNNGKHAHQREVKAVARSQDNKYLVSASVDGTLKVWDMETERHINTLSGHNDEVWCACISSDNEIVVSGSRDGTIRLWRLKSGQEICTFNAGVDVFYITMSNDKGTIVALGDKFGARKLIMLQVVRSKVKRQVLA